MAPQGAIFVFGIDSYTKLKYNGCMKTACITQVRDECDIIELFCRINAKFFDHLFIINNNSCDATQVILDKLIKEGLPITVAFDVDNSYNQAVYTAGMQNILRRGEFDWVFPLDGDEFLNGSKKNILEALEKVPRNHLPKLRWRSWVPLTLDYWESDTPLFDNFAPLVKENHDTFKVAVHKSQGMHLTLDRGNHSAKLTSSGMGIPTMDCGVRINHFPVRSADQIISKALLNQYRQGPRLHEGERIRTYGLLDILNALRKYNYNVNLEMLQYFATSYNRWLPPSGNDPHNKETADEGFMPCMQIKYHDLSRIQLALRFDKQLAIMHKEVMNAKAMVPITPK